MTKQLIAMIIGLAFLASAAISAHSTRSFLRTSIVAPGKVVALNAGGSHPQIEFVTRSGERISYPQGGMISDLKTGDTVRVRYRPGSALVTATLDRFGAVWYWPLMFSYMGFGFFGCGLSSLLLRRTK